MTEAEESALRQFVADGFRPFPPHPQLIVLALKALDDLREANSILQFERDNYKAEAESWQRDYDDLRQRHELEILELGEEIET